MNILTSTLLIFLLPNFKMSVTSYQYWDKTFKKIVLMSSPLPYKPYTLLNQERFLKCFRFFSLSNCISYPEWVQISVRTMCLIVVSANMVTALAATKIVSHFQLRRSRSPTIWLQYILPSLLCTSHQGTSSSPRQIYL